MTQVEIAELIARLRQGVIIMGFGPGDKEMVDTVTANQAMRKAADALEARIPQEDELPDGLLAELKEAIRFNAPDDVRPGYRRVGFILPDHVAWPKDKTGYDIPDAILAALEGRSGDVG